MITTVLLVVGCFGALAGGFAAGWRVRGRVPVRIPTNATRIEDAKTDVEVAEEHLKRRELGYKGEAMDIRASLVLDGMRRQIEEYQPVVIDPGADGTDDLVTLVLKARREKGMTQSELGAAARIPERRLRCIFAGESPTVEDLHKLARALDLHLEPPQLSRPVPPPQTLPAIPASFVDDRTERV